MKRIITKNDLMMFITDENIMDEYLMEPSVYIFFVFKNGSCVDKIGISSFIKEKPTDCNYVYTDHVMFTDKNGNRIVEFYFEKV